MTTAQLNDSLRMTNNGYLFNPTVEEWQCANAHPFHFRTEAARIPGMLGTIHPITRTPNLNPEPEQMTIENVPIIGTAKQNAYACRLATQCGYNTLDKAVRAALGSIPVTIDPDQASTIIKFLLAEAKGKGLTVFAGKKAKKGGWKNKGPKPDAAPAAPATLAGIDTAALLAELETRGGIPDLFDTVKKADSKVLALVLEDRGFPATLAVQNPELCGKADTLLTAARAVLNAYHRAAILTESMQALAAIVDSI